MLHRLVLTDDKSFWPQYISILWLAEGGGGGTAAGQAALLFPPPTSGQVPHIFLPPPLPLTVFVVPSNSCRYQHFDHGPTIIRSNK